MTCHECATHEKRADFYEERLRDRDAAILDLRTMVQVLIDLVREVKRG